METVSVDAKALRDILSALKGPAHYIRELMVVDGLPGDEGSISKLVRQYNEAVKKHDSGGISKVEADARRYNFLRDADIESIREGGLFAGITPDNIALNGEDLDIEIDKRLGK